MKEEKKLVNNIKDLMDVWNELLNKMANVVEEKELTPEERILKLEEEVRLLKIEVEANKCRPYYPTYPYYPYYPYSPWYQEYPWWTSQSGTISCNDAITTTDITQLDNTDWSYTDGNNILDGDVQAFFVTEHSTSKDIGTW